MIELIGRTGFRKLAGYTVEFEIREVSDAGYGRVLYRVKPVAGYGESWIEAHELRLRPVDPPDECTFQRKAA